MKPSIFAKQNKVNTIKPEDMYELDKMSCYVYNSAWDSNKWDKWCPLGLNSVAIEGAFRYKIWELLKGPFKKAPLDIDEFGAMCLSLLQEVENNVFCFRSKIGVMGYEHGCIALTCNVDWNPISTKTLFIIHIPIKIEMDFPDEEKEFYHE